MGGGLSWHPTPPGQRLGIRLVNGSNHCSGTVEVWLKLSWEPVCGELWDSLASEAVCLALGCGGAWETTQPTLPFLEKLPGPGVGNSSAAPNSTLALAPAVLCRSPDWKLCKVVEHACNSSGMPAKVTCAGTRGPPPAPCPPHPQAFSHCPSLLSPVLATAPKPYPPDIPPSPTPPQSQTELVPTLEDCSIASSPLQARPLIRPQTTPLLDLPFDHLGPQSLLGLWSLLVSRLLSDRTSISAPTSPVQVPQCPLALSLSSPNLLFRPRPPGY